MTTAAHAVLVVDDEPQLRRLLHATLAAEGFRVIEAENARRGLIEAASHKPDLVILDLGLPDAEGHTVVRGIRDWSSLPIVVLSARVDEQQKIAALDAGADDYVTKPFARGRVACARAGGAQTRGAPGRRRPAAAARPRDDQPDAAHRDRPRWCDPLHADSSTGCWPRSRATMARWRPSASCCKEVWGPDRVDQPHYLRIYMKQLREKIEPDPTQPRFFKTETGVGYRLVADVDASV